MIFVGIECGCCGAEGQALVRDGVLIPPDGWLMLEASEGKGHQMARRLEEAWGMWLCPEHRHVVENQVFSMKKRLLTTGNTGKHGE